MGSKDWSPRGSSCLAGKVLIEDLPKRSISNHEIEKWLKKYGNISEIVVYSRCLVVQFDSDIEAAGAVQCENGALLFGTKVSVKHMEASDLKALRRAGPPIDRFPSHSQRHSGSTSDRDRDKERGRISSRRDQFRDRSRTPDTKRPRDVSPRRHSRSPVKSRNDRRTVHPLNWLSEVAERDNKLNGSSLLGSAAVPIEKPVVKSPPYLVAIITVQHYLVPYAEIIEQRITKTLNPSGGPPITHIVVLLSADHLQPCLADLTKDGVPFAITCTMPNKSHNSCSLRILYTPTQHEHRNMPLDGAMSLLHREYTAYMTKITSEEKTDPPEDANFLPPSRHLASLLRMLADSRVLSIGELDEISAFVLERKRRLEGHQTGLLTTKLVHNIIGNGDGMDSSKLELPLEQKMKLMEMFIDKQTGSVSPSSNPNHTMLPSVDGIVNSITQFSYDPHANVTFDKWYQRHENLFTIDLASQDDACALRNSENLSSSCPDPPSKVPRKSTHTRPTSQNAAKKYPPSPCWCCGAWHFIKSCPYKNNRCNKCKIIGHKNGFCQPPRYHNPAKAPPTVGPKSPRRSFSLLATSEVTTPGMRKYLDFQINGHDARLQLDTASDITVISEKLWNDIGRPHITNTSQTAVSACGGRLKLIGELKCSVSFRNAEFTGICYVTKIDLNLLGLDWIDCLHLADVPLNSLCNAVKKHKMSDNSGQT
uniref:RRM domain-containing protein n=1 Tax=Trichobilharzia regenti TaxID=157069 RepID=A0AA85IUP2_TRIRE|nr:unnamed protein product [Trichobilharzia regenti]